MTRDRQEIAVELLSTGLSQHQLSLLVELLASLPSRDVTHNARYERDDIKREQGRLRQQNYRNRKRNGAGMAAHAETKPERDVTHNERDGAYILSSSLLPLKKEESEEVRKEESKKVTRAKRKPAVPLPDDWQPKPAHFAKARQLGRPEGFVESKAEDLRIWAQSNDARKQDWDATFHGFIRRDNGVSNGQRAQTRSVQDSARELAARARASLDHFNKPAPRDSRLCDGAGGPHVRLLSKG